MKNFDLKGTFVVSHSILVPSTWVPICEMYSICILPAFKNDISASCLSLLAHTFMNMGFLFCLVLQSSVFFHLPASGIDHRHVLILTLIVEKLI